MEYSVEVRLTAVGERTVEAGGPEAEVVTVTSAIGVGERVVRVRLVTVGVKVAGVGGVPM